MPVILNATRRMWSKAPGLAAALGLMTVCLVAAPAYATVLTAGDTTLSAAGIDPETGGTVIDVKISPVGAPTFTGSLISKVINNDPTNVNGPAALTFTYQFSNLGPNAISRLTVSSFASFAADVFFVASPDVTPWLFDRSLSDDVIGFSFIGSPIGFGKVTAGKTSDKLVIQTDAIRYQDTLAAVINGSTAMPDSFAPVAIVPEPSSVFLTIVGTIGLVGFAVRRLRR